MACSPHIPGRWYYVGAICVASVGQAVNGWSALVDRHQGAGKWRSALAPDMDTAIHWVEGWAVRESGRLASEVVQMRIGPNGWPVWVEGAN